MYIPIYINVSDAPIIHDKKKVPSTNDFSSAVFTFPALSLIVKYCPGFVIPFRSRTADCRGENPYHTSFCF